MTDAIVPLSPPPNASTPAPGPIPHRKLIREWMAPLSARSTPLALSLVALDTVLFVAALAATVWVRQPVLQLLFALATGFVIARLFTFFGDRLDDGTGGPGHGDLSWTARRRRPRRPSTPRGLPRGGPYTYAFI